MSSTFPYLWLQITELQDCLHITVAWRMWGNKEGAQRSQKVTLGQKKAEACVKRNSEAEVILQKWTQLDAQGWQGHQGCAVFIRSSNWCDTRDRCLCLTCCKWESCFWDCSKSSYLISVQDIWEEFIILSPSPFQPLSLSVGSWCLTASLQLQSMLFIVLIETSAPTLPESRVALLNRWNEPLLMLLHSCVILIPVWTPLS